MKEDPDYKYALTPKEKARYRQIMKKEHLRLKGKKKPPAVENE